MDANGTRFHLILGYDDWARCTDEAAEKLGPALVAPPAPCAESSRAGLGWQSDRAELTLRPCLFQFQAAANDRAPAPEDRRGAARDRYGNWFWIDANRQEIRVNSAGTSVTSHFWSPGDGLDCQPPARPGDFGPKDLLPAPPILVLSGLAVTEDHFLVVGTLQPAGLLIFDLFAGGPPTQLLWPAGVPFAPFDMAAAPGGGTWILDRANRSYWALDRRWQVIRRTATPPSPAAEDFQPMDGSAVRQAQPAGYLRGITADAAFPLAAQDPIAIESLPDCSVLILDRNPGQPFSLIYHDSFGQELQILSLEAFQLSGHDIAYLAAHSGSEGQVADRLYVAAAQGNQSFAFTLQQPPSSPTNPPLFTLELVGEYLPMRLFGGKALVAADTRVYYDFADRWIPLVEQRRPRFAQQGTLLTRIFDGRDPACTWHRLMLDACLPPETEVQVWSRTSEDQEELPHVDWQPEPRLYRRSDGSELPYTRQPYSDNQAGTYELLFQRAKGRYLQLKLTLRGNGRTSPRLRALRAYYPRFSYLNHYLPAVYREEPGPASFLERFLANLEGFYTTTEDKIAALQVLFDPRTAPPETLDWLASWFGVALDPNWDEARRRLFIQHALDFFQYRGTIRGLLMALRLVLEGCPDESIFRFQPQQGGSATYLSTQSCRIVEKYRTRRIPAAVLGDPTDLSGLRRVAAGTAWTPQQGGAPLHARYNALLGSPASFEPFPVQDPGGAKSAAWRQAAQEILGFVPAAIAAAEETWQDFLAHRYQRISALNITYGEELGDFSGVSLPLTLPSDGAPLWDWYQFETILLAMWRTAHTFTVLLPVPKELAFDTNEHQRRRALVERVVNLEKPAHTVFDIKFFWAMFRVGEARLGEDTLIDQGSRAPQLLPPLILGQGYLAESYLDGGPGPGHPPAGSSRFVVGREELAS